MLCVFFFFFFFVYFIITFRFYFIPLFINIIVFLDIFLIMIFPLLVSGVREIVLGRARAGCPCNSRVMAFVWNYSSRHC